MTPEEKETERLLKQFYANMGKNTEVDQFVLTAAYLLRGAGDAVSITQKVNRLSAKTIRYAIVFTSLYRLEKNGLVASRFGDPLPELDGECEEYFTITPAGEMALARLRVEASNLMDALGDFA